MGDSTLLPEVKKLGHPGSPTQDQSPGGEGLLPGSKMLIFYAMFVFILIFKNLALDSIYLAFWFFCFVLFFGVIFNFLPEGSALLSSP